MLMQGVIPPHTRLPHPVRWTAHFSWGPRGEGSRRDDTRVLVNKGSGSRGPQTNDPPETLQTDAPAIDDQDRQTRLTTVISAGDARCCAGQASPWTLENVLEILQVREKLGLYSVRTWSMDNGQYPLPTTMQFQARVTLD